MIQDQGRNTYFNLIPRFLFIDMSMTATSNCWSYFAVETKTQIKVCTKSNGKINCIVYPQMPTIVEVRSNSFWLATSQGKQADMYSTSITIMNEANHSTIICTKPVYWLIKRLDYGCSKRVIFYCNFMSLGQFSELNNFINNSNAMFVSCPLQSE